VDFSSITSDLAAIKSGAQSAGIYLPPSSAQGYSLVFNNDSTISIYRVNSLRSHATGYDVNGQAHNEDIDYGTGGGARTKLDGNPSLAGTQNYQMPTNGLIYIEDKTWVEGIVNGKVLVAAAKLPYNAASAPSIVIPNNIVYTAKNGNHVLGLIGQKDVLVSYFAPDNLEINAAMIAQNGSIQRYDFSGNLKTQITIFGAVSSFGVWTWSWVNGSGNCTSGYCNTNTTYDGNLLFGPPPSFPLSAEGYQTISWNSD
jgi:hypothetical protein